MPSYPAGMTVSSRALTYGNGEVVGFVAALDHLAVREVSEMLLWPVKWWLVRAGWR